MTTIHDDLRAVLDAVAIQAADCYAIQDDRRDLSKFPKPADGSSPLPFALASDLYAKLYTRSRHTPTAFDALAQRDLVSALSTANTGRGTWEPQWKVGEVDDDGRIAVTKDGLTVWVATSGLRARDDRVVPGEFCRVRVGKEIRGLMPGFYVAIGDGDEDDRRDDEEPLIRLYWNLTAKSAVAYMAAATSRLNAAGVPFRTKVLNDPAFYDRADAGVLYFGKRYYDRLRSPVAKILKDVEGGLRPEVPLFTKKLAPGLGLAEDPRNDMSFGQHRCHLIAQALWKAFEHNESDREAAGARAVPAARRDPQPPPLGAP
jgi:hypothetical protein